MEIWNDIVEAINSTLNSSLTLQATHTIGGGCINQAWKLEMEDGAQGISKSFFVKSNAKNLQHMFAAENAALIEIAETKTIRVPNPIEMGVSGNNCWIAMEFLEMSGTGSAQQLGQQLAAMHRTCRKDYGWHRDNTIGSTPQPNTQSASWVDFWREQRLGYQLETSARKGYSGKLQALGDQVMSKLDLLFDGYVPQASLLHGDLWGGNWSGLTDGTPVIFDPASYYGDRETDIAMTELFGGFSETFYQAYNENWPLDEGYGRRKILYNLYHILNHLNLFGGSYAGQAESMMQQILFDL